MDEGWVISSPQQGDMPEEYGISAKKGILDNYFDIELGGDLDMAVKIVNIETERPIRYVYVPAGSTTTINELPKGKYYLKLTYGKDWMISYDGNKTIGKFTREANYEKTTSMFDFGDKNTLDAVSYSLKIHIEQDSRYENLSTTEISEQEFFND
ncbi:MAG: hypothetical protein IJ764_02715 [Bacteroidales bacterium]|nr:hypothetical protein [Bacteroidales bacterium]